MICRFLQAGKPRTSATGDLRALTLPARLVLVWILSIAACQAGPVTSFDDILFWTGSGSHRSALVLDWQGNSTSDNALAWGYRWEGSAQGSDLLLDIVAADPRLYAKVGAFGFGVAVFGLGYDANDDGSFALDDRTFFATTGIAQVAGPEEGATAVDPADWYVEGWLLTGFWHYGVASSSPYDGGTWINAAGGISVRSLADGSWDSLAFSPTYSLSAFGQNPIAAVPAVNADFNADGRVDGTDFLNWQRGFGISTGATLSNGDADGNGAVDAADLGHWQNHYGVLSGSPLQSAGRSVPEPALLLLTILVFLTVPLIRHL